MVNKLLATFCFAAVAAWGATAGFFMYFAVTNLITKVIGGM